MNLYLLCAAVLTLVIGVVHSVLGEQRIFGHLRRCGLVPTEGAPVLREFQVRILWACWHLLSLLGFGLAGVLWWLAQPGAQQASGGVLEWVIAVTMTASGLLVLVSNRGRHPAWVAFFAVAALVMWGR